MSESPNWYSTSHQFAASSCMAGGFYPTEQLVVGFPATGLLIFNACSDRVFWNLKTAPTTGDAYIAGCSALALSNLPPFGGITLLSTTTSTAAGGKPIVNVSAWASA